MSYETRMMDNFMRSLFQCSRELLPFGLMYWKILPPGRIYYIRHQQVAFVWGFPGYNAYPMIAGSGISDAGFSGSVEPGKTTPDYNF
jgi:hypothetical protein